jgi:hypothetical protein
MGWLKWVVINPSCKRTVNDFYFEKFNDLLVDSSWHYTRIYCPLNRKSFSLQVEHNFSLPTWGDHTSCPCLMPLPHSWVLVMVGIRNEIKIKKLKLMKNIYLSLNNWRPSSSSIIRTSINSSCLLNPRYSFELLSVTGWEIVNVKSEMKFSFHSLYSLFLNLIERITQIFIRIFTFSPPNDAILNPTNPSSETVSWFENPDSVRDQTFENEWPRFGIRFRFGCNRAEP